MEGRKSDHTQLERVRQEFSRAKAYASEYEGKTPIGHFFEIRIRRVAELLNGFVKGRVLDVGCGPAKVAAIFQGKPIEYYGVDVSEEMTKTGVDTFGRDEHFHAAIGEIEELGFVDQAFDVVLSLGVLEYVLNGEAAIREVARVLKPNGILIATMLNKNSPYRLWRSHVYWKAIGAINKLVRLIKGYVSQRERVEGTVSEMPRTVRYGEKALKELLTSGGLSVEDVLYYDFEVIPAPLDARIPRISSFLSSKLEFLCRSRLRFLGTGFMVKCRKNGPTRP